MPARHQGGCRRQRHTGFRDEAREKEVERPGRKVIAASDACLLALRCGASCLRGGLPEGQQTAGQGDGGRGQGRATSRSRVAAGLAGNDGRRAGRGREGRTKHDGRTSSRKRGTTTAPGCLADTAAWRSLIP
ncbi:hypothetical protein BRI6_0762 [plant metagenome]|uniref:Uncharacterized protein n=1 Tax=plant metagenome TaxID=1297885 RepID=A0A484RU04_9ZZZZ